MKIYNYKILLLLLFMSLCIKSYSQEESEYFYYYKGEKVFLELDTKIIALITEGENSPQTIKTYFVGKTDRNLTLNQEDNTRRIATIIDQKAQDRKDIKTYYMEITSDHPLSPLEYNKQVEDYKKIPSVISVSPCFVSNGKREDKIGLLNTFYVKLKDEGDVNFLYEKAEKLNIEVLGHNQYMPLWFTLACGKERNSLEAANLFYETGLFESTEPGFLSQIKTNYETNKVENKTLSNTPNLITTPNDPYYKYQWGLKNTGQMGDDSPEGIDIKAEGAWSITTGSPDIKVAIIDSGIQMSHPDLKDNIFGMSYNAHTNTSPLTIYGEHGTACAGIVAAVQNNGIGITGVAPNCKLMSVGLDFTQIITPEIISNAINWAWQNGADVISMSTSDREKNNPKRKLVDEAINNAYSKGRNGKGTIIISSAGNNNKDKIGFPASNPFVLAVGAIDSFGERFRFPNWLFTNYGSNYGEGLDVVAPGELSILTTDLIGNKGYNNGNNPEEFRDSDYTKKFGATSAACPFVSGIAALILSVNPELTVAKVYDIIVRTTRKISPNGRYVYSEHSRNYRPDATWNNEMGYGLVNAEAAVKRAAGTIMCLEDETVTENISEIEFIQTSRAITAFNLVKRAANVIYQAGHSILLKAGFVAEPGSVFEAGIEECSGNNGQRKANVLPEKKITYAFRYNTSRNSIVENQEDFNVVPNPFTQKTKIHYQVAANAGNINISVYSITGIKIANLLEKDIESGTHSIEWDTTGFSSGIYLITLSTANEKKVIKGVKL